MGEFDHESGGEDSAPMGKMAQAEKCRPDFEGLIEQEKDKQLLLASLYESTKAVVMSKLHFGGLQKTRLKDLMGSLHVRLEISAENIESLFKQVEDYKD
jgi:hypothetical protein